MTDRIDFAPLPTPCSHCSKPMTPNGPGLPWITLAAEGDLIRCGGCGTFNAYRPDGSLRLAEHWEASIFLRSHKVGRVWH